MMRFKFVSFDLNGVVLKPARSIGEIYCDSASKLGIVLSPKKLDVNFVESMAKMKNKYPHFGGGGIGWESWWKKTVRMTFESTLEKNELKKIEPQFDKMSDQLLHLFSTKEPWELHKGITRLLDDLKRNKVAVGAITNSDPRVGSILKDFGILNHFLFIITSYESNMSKPDQRVFQLAETKFKQKTGHFDQSQVVHIGDSYSKDALGALGAGWNAILIKKDASVIPDEHRKLVFTDLNEVGDYLLPK